jgi:hypothetical protein
MIPKSRKDILNICQRNFFNYSTLSKVMIIVSALLSATIVALYLVKCIIPTIQGILCEEIVGWDILWEIIFAVALYYIIALINVVCVCIGGTAMCREENWQSIDFAKAWVNIYKYEKYLKDDENF